MRVPKIITIILCKEQCNNASKICLKGMANRLDPDLTAPPQGAVRSGSALFAQTYLPKYLKLLYNQATELTSGVFISGNSGISMGGKSGSCGTLGSRSRSNTKLISLDGSFSETGEGDFGGGGVGVRG